MNDKLKNFTAEPDSEVWGKINSSLFKAKARRQLATGLIGAAVVTGLITGVILWPSQPKQTAVSEQQPMVAQQEASEQPVSAEVQTLAIETMPTEATAQASAKMETAETKVAMPVPAVVENHSVATLFNISELPVAAKSEGTVAAAPKESTAATGNTAKMQPAETASTEAEPQQSEAAAPVAAHAPKAVIPNAPEKDTLLWIPNGFIPSQGQTFHVILNQDASSVKNFRMTIFNRQGHQVFNTTDINMAWDGTYKGRELPKAAYVCVVAYTDKDGITHQRKATVLLIR